jgi:chaperone required for assembly of F1-ATPase
MRDLFDQLCSAAALDPTEAARRNMRPQARQRFYRQAGAGNDFSVLLDGKPVKTPANRALRAPNAALAQAIAGEWQAQREVIDPRAMPLTRLANAIIDGVAEAPAEVTREIEKYLGSDLVFYRGEAPEGLVARQAQMWDPLIDFARDALGARFVLAQGVVHAAQPAAAVAAAARAIPSDIWRLGAVAALTTLTGSALMALALAAGRLAADEAWDAAHVDEDWQMEKWGRDDEAQARRAARRAEFDAAVLILNWLR